MVEVTVNDEWITCKAPEGTITSVSWQDVQTVFIETNDLGPFEPDVFWVIVGVQAKCIIPQGATGEDALIDKLQSLPNFNNEVFADAMSSTANSTFLCWQKS